MTSKDFDKADDPWSVGTVTTKLPSGFDSPAQGFDGIPEPERTALIQPLVVWLLVISVLFLVGLQMCGVGI